jgi:MFS family permease
MTEPEKQEAGKQTGPTEQYASMSTDVAAPQDPESGVDQSVIGPAWMYKPLFKIGKWEAPYFASPEMQLYLVSFVCFLCPGMFNAVSGLGGGGQVNTHDVNNANTALYSTFAVVGFFAGSIANRIGLRLTLSLGGFGYFLYVAALLSYNINQNAAFLIFAGALLGVCAGLLWCAQGAVMLSYPHEHEKGKYIAIFWVIFNLGGVIGSLVRSLFTPWIPNNILISAGPSRPKYAFDRRQR